MNKNQINNLMEAKKFISTLKGYRTKFSKAANPAKEKQMVESLIEKMGGKLDAMVILKTSDEELLAYAKQVLGYVKVTPDPIDPIQVANSKDGKVYEIDTIKGTCKRVMGSFKDIDINSLDLDEMPMKVYHRYLLDKFPGEGAKMKKDKLYFRECRIYCNKENGFTIEDVKSSSKIETPFEGIPTPRELGDFFVKPLIEHTPEELSAAVKRGKELLKKPEKETIEEDEEDVDFELLRKKTISKMIMIRDGKLELDPLEFVNLIPFKPWRRKVNVVVKDWKSRKIRFKKLIDRVEEITREQSFEVEEKKHSVTFDGTILPTFRSIGSIIGNKIEIDGKLQDAVPFMLDYILYYEPKAMQQIMRFAHEEISEVELIQNPYYDAADAYKIEYKKRALINSAKNAQILSCVCASVGLVAPQDLLYEADLQVGDFILIFVDGDWKKQQIKGIENGITLSREIGLLKLDKWIKLESKKPVDTNILKFRTKEECAAKVLELTKKGIRFSVAGRLELLLCD